MATQEAEKPRSRLDGIGPELLAIARSRVKVIHPNDPSLAKHREEGATILTLTPLEDLNERFVPEYPRTLYSFFCRTEDDRMTVIVLDLNPGKTKERAVREAALGLMDNPYFR